MRLTALPRVVPATLFLGLAIVASGAAQAIATSDARWTPTRTRAQDLAREGAVHVAALRDGEPVRVAVTLQVRDKAGLDALTADLMSGRSRRTLSSEEFLERHAPTEAQAQAVVDHLQRAGFRNVRVAENRLVVSADGNAASARNAFRADLHEYDVKGRRAYASTTDAQVPQHLAGTVLAVTGLQTVARAHTTARKAAAPGAESGMQPQLVTGVEPRLFPQIYGAASLPPASNATIAVVVQGDVAPTIADLKAFASQNGYPVPPVSVVTVGVASTDTSGIDEWNMDTQSALAAAGGTVRSMLLYTATTLYDSDLTVAFNRIVSDNRAKVINVSLGECETDARDTGVIDADDAIFQVAVAQGQTFSVSSGDSGAYECGVASTTSQSYPAVSPYVMAIGGTRLSTTGGTWVSETAWSCNSALNCQQSAMGGTGGGVSRTEDAPAWQRDAGVLGTSTKRGVPDISFDGSPDSGAFITVHGVKEQIAGTSLSAPLFAGFWARIQSAHGNTLPFPAATLYAGAAAHPQWFHDVSSGSNGGYSAKPGWDYTTGFGSLNVGAFNAAFGTGPVASFTAVATGLSVKFTDQSGVTSGSITDREWNFGDGSPRSHSINPTHVYAAAGTYTVIETITDNTGRKASRNRAVKVAVATRDPEAIVNGQFETGSAKPWNLSAGVLCTNAACDGGTAHAGTGFLWMDGWGMDHVDVAEQTITLATGSTAKLTYWLHVESEDTGTVAHDTLRTQVLDATTGAILKEFVSFSNLHAKPGYVLKTFSMTPWIGKTVKVRLLATEDASLTTSFMVDDVSVRIEP